MRKTLRQIIAEHPDWLDLTVGVYTPNGSIDFVGENGTVYKSTDEVDGLTFPVLVFAAN